MNAATMPGSAHSLVDAAQASTLAEYAFIDLYISIGKGAYPPVIKGLRPRNQLGREGPSGMVGVPANLRGDVTNLARKIHEQHAIGGSHEFTVTHGGTNYRCALIAEPEEGVARPRPASAIKNWCIRHLNDRIPRSADLGYPPEIMRSVLAMRKERGLLLVSGSFGSGKTTSASVFIDEWVRMEREVGVTLEDPPELPLQRITEDEGIIYQIDLTEKPFHVAIKKSRRWAPRYVFMGEIRTPESAAELLHMSISGPMVLCTIHAADPIQAIVSLCRFASSVMSERSAREMVAASLHTVLHQSFVNNKLAVKMATIAGDDNFGVRNKIENGLFQRIYEDIDRQRINRSRNGGA